MTKILIIEDDAAFCQMLQKFLQRKGYAVETSFTAPDAKVKFKSTNFDVILTDLRLPDYDGLLLLADIKAEKPTTQVILMTGYAEVTTAVNAMKNGAFDYISKPFTPDDIVKVIEAAIQVSTNEAPIVKIESESAKKKLKAIKSKAVIGVSEASKTLDEYVHLVAPTDMSVLIIGESGTGKEVTAKAIHDLSERSSFNFIAVDCGAIPKELAASEFFGHIKGSFTGAVEDKIGTFEAANKGTLFLDEIGNLSYENQVHLLRAIQERKIKRVGGTKETDVDLRIIAATNEDLNEAVAKGTFREDLYHRLNEFSILIPSLEERFDDLLLFAERFLDEANNNLNKNVQGFSAPVLAAFKEYQWPGNLRELKNVIKRAVLLTTGNEITITALPREIVNPSAKSLVTDSFSKTDYEKERIIKALKQTNFNKTKAANLLQITRKTLYNKINHYKLENNL